jgi:hypothetical protein
VEKKNFLRVQHLTASDTLEVEREVVLGEVESRIFRQWVDKHLRGERNQTIHDVMPVLSSCVYSQAFEQGRQDALHDRISSNKSTNRLWQRCARHHG